jgi:hypothetical protein
MTHFCLHTKRGRKAALKLFETELTFWKGHLFLRAWQFSVQHLDDQPANVNSSLADTAISARTYSEPDYKQARIDLWMDDQGCISGEQIIGLVAHEVVHIMLSPVTQGWEKALVAAYDDGDKFELVRPFLYGPEEGLAEDLAFILCQYREKAASRASRAKKK